MSFRRSRLFLAVSDIGRLAAASFRLLLFRAEDCSLSGNLSRLHRLAPLLFLLGLDFISFPVFALDSRFFPRGPSFHPFSHPGPWLLLFAYLAALPVSIRGLWILMGDPRRLDGHLFILFSFFSMGITSLLWLYSQNFLWLSSSPASLVFLSLGAALLSLASITFSVRTLSSLSRSGSSLPEALEDARAQLSLARIRRSATPPGNPGTKPSFNVRS